MGIEILAFPPSPRSFKVLLTAAYAKVDYRLRVVNLGAREQKTDEVARLNVNQRIPVLRDGDYTLWESNAICEYLALHAPALMPAEPRARLQVAKWLYWEAAHWDPACVPYVFENVVKPLFGMGDADAAALAKAAPNFARAADVLETVLGETAYIAGDTLTLADLAIAAPLCAAARARFPLDPYPAIARWRGRIESLPAWQQATALQRPPVAA